jgi:putative ABC transport system permease protein
MRLTSILRGLGRTTGFCAAVVGTIALGIGASSAMFSVVYAVLLHPLPYPAPERLVMVWQTLKLDPALGVDPEVAARLAQRSAVISTMLPAWRQDNHVFEDMGGFLSRPFSLTGTPNPEIVDGIVATSSFFHVLGVQPIAGRLFTVAEEQPGRDDVVLLSHALWQRRFGRDPQAIGRSIDVDGVPHTIVGVLPPDVHLVLPRATRSPALVTPISHAFQEDRKWTLMNVVGRLKPGATAEAAGADMAAVMKRLGDADPRYRRLGVTVFPLASEVSRESRRVLLILLAATGCVLLIAGTNVANLLMVRAGTTRRGLAIRAALGASRGRLVREAMTESLLLATAGGAAGLLIARWVTKVVVAMMPPDLFPRMEDVAIGVPVIAFGVAVTIAVGVAAGFAPAWYARRADRRAGLSTMLKQSTGATTSGPALGLVRRGLVALEVGIAMVVLVAAVLLTKTYIRLTHVDLGVQPQNVLTFDVTLPPARYKDPAARIAFAEALVERLQALGGVDAAGLASSLPVQSSFAASMSGVTVEGQPPSESGAILVLRMVTPGVFKAAGIRLAHGRLLQTDDARSDAIVVNRAMVRRFWPAASASQADVIGRRVSIGKRWSQIVGIVDDVKYDGPQSRVEAEAYVSYPYWAVEHLAVVLRSTGDPLVLAPAARQVVKSLDPDLPLNAIRTLEGVLAGSVAPPRFRSALVGSFAVLALILALVGLYGVVSQSVSQRAKEIGIRMALGADESRIHRMVVGETLLLATFGVVVGGAGAFIASRVLASLLFQTSATDPSTYATVALAIAAASAAASYGPARRAANADPVAVLRAE